MTAVKTKKPRTHSGMPCPVCGTPTQTKNSRPDNGVIRRFRVCENKHSFYTVETVTEEKIPYTRIKAKVISKKQKQINKLMPMLTEAQARTATKFFEAKWTVKEVTAFFDIPLYKVL